MDTARADRAFDPDVMPNLHQIASDGTRFTRAFSTAPWTLPSHAAMFTGQYTSNHGTHAGTKQFDPDVPTLAEGLANEGYQTVAFSNNTWVSSEFGFDRGFEEFYVGWELLRGGADLPTIAKSYQGVLSQAQAIGRELLSTDAPQTLVNAAYTKLLRKRYDNGARVTNWRINRWLSKRRDERRPFFMFVNYLEPHLKYEPPKQFRERFLGKIDPDLADAANQDAWAYVCGEIEMSDWEFDALSALYDAELAYLDHRIGNVYDRFREQGLVEDTVIVIVADHGENIGEHELMDHQYCLYDTLTHVPLVVRLPEGSEHTTDEDALIELRDLYPTILDVASADHPEHEDVSNRSLLDGVDREHVVSEYLTPQPSIDTLENRVKEVSADVKRYDRALRSVRTAKWKYIEGTDGSEELYDIEIDPGEMTNVADDHPGVCDELAGLLTTERGKLVRGDRDGATAAVDETTEQRLEDLGYLQ